MITFLNEYISVYVLHWNDEDNPVHDSDFVALLGL